PAKRAARRESSPDARPSDWYKSPAGQRGPVIKGDAKTGGVLQFGTELVTGSDGTIAGLLRASPGASTAAPIMFGLLEACFPGRIEAWSPVLREMVPSLGRSLGESPKLAEKTLVATARALELPRTARGA